MTPWVSRLIFANVLVFLLTYAVPGLSYVLALVPARVPLTPWTPITYMFVHGGVWHLLFNMIVLYFFGQRVELRLGGRRFLALYLLSGLGGAALSLLTPYVAIVGASGATYGVFLAFALYWPHDRIFIWGVLPVKAWVLVVVTTVYSLYAGFGAAGDNIAHFAHLGGYVAAFLYLKWVDRRSEGRSFQRKVATATYGRPSPAAVEEPRWDLIKRDGLHEMTLEELDRLSAKVKEQGMGSLTADERAFLYRMAAR